MLLRLTELDQQKIKVEEKVCNHVASCVFHLMCAKNLTLLVAGPVSPISEKHSGMQIRSFFRSISLS